MADESPGAGALEANERWEQRAAELRAENARLEAESWRGRMLNWSG